MVCKAVGTEPDHGLTEPHLLRVYTELNLGNIEQDFVLMGLELGLLMERRPPRSTHGGALFPYTARVR
eukprot:COSAG05_NODE_10011_length_588_cov_0.957055_2_plen_67_part_01